MESSFSISLPFVLAELDPFAAMGVPTMGVSAFRPGVFAAGVKTAGARRLLVLLMVRS